MAASGTIGERPVITLPAGGTIAAFSRVKLSSGTVVVSGSDEAALGITGSVAVVSGENVAVELFFPTYRVITAAATTVGAALYSVATGKVSPTDPGSATIRYYALQAAGAADNVIEVAKYG